MAAVEPSPAEYPSVTSNDMLRRRAGLMAPAMLAAMLALGACVSAPPATFDLTAPGLGKVGPGRGQLAVAEPLSVQALDSDRIIVKDQTGSISFLGGGQWADRLPRLVQTRLIQTFENANRLTSVGRPGGALSADIVLNTEIRSFQISSATNQAVVEITAKLIGSSGRVIAGRMFSARVPVAKIDGASAAQALDKALGQVLVQIVRWASGSS